MGDRTAAITLVTVPLPSGFTKFAGGHEAMTSGGGRGPPGILIYQWKSSEETDWKCSQYLDLELEHCLYVM
jgi:hypothetical protein